MDAMEIFPKACFEDIPMFELLELETPNATWSILQADVVVQHEINRSWKKTYHSGEK
jgi:hypothetical protein